MAIFFCLILLWLPTDALITSVRGSQSGCHQTPLFVALNRICCNEKLIKIKTFLWKIYRKCCLWWEITYTQTRMYQHETPCKFRMLYFSIYQHILSEGQLSFGSCLARVWQVHGIHMGEPEIGSRQICFFFLEHIDGLVQDCSNSSALAMELLQSCT